MHAATSGSDERARKSEAGEPPLPVMATFRTVPSATPRIYVSCAAPRARVGAVAVLTWMVLGLAACQNTTAARSASPSARREPSKHLQAFVVAVEVLSSSPGDATRPQIVDAFSKLADALREPGRGPELRARAERLTVLARRLADRALAAGPDSDVTQAALREAVGVLQDLGAPESRSAREGAAAALARFDPRRPLLAQVATVRTVLGHVANGLLQDSNLNAAIDTRRSISASAAEEVSAVPSIDSARSASERVTILAASSASDLREALAAALEAFASSLESDDRTSERDAWITTVRTNAGRIRSRDVLGTDATPAAKAALSATLDVMERDGAGGRSPVVTDLLARARAAVGALQDTSFLSFQRAPLQEACRIIADALLITSDAATRSGAGARVQ